MAEPHKPPPKRLSTPPPIGSEVEILRPGWALGLRGKVIAHGELHDGAKDRDGRPVKGQDCTVKLRVAVGTRWKDHAILQAAFLLEWEVRKCG